MGDQIAVGILSALSLLVGTVAGGFVQAALLTRQSRIEMTRSALAQRRLLYSEYLAFIYDFDRIIDRAIRRPESEHLEVQDELAQRALPLRVGLALDGSPNVKRSVEA